jgi:uncharacterized membrane protein
MKTEINHSKKNLSIILLVGIGCVLRFYHLGLKGFWFDEIGVANVAYAENIFQILRISKSHVMAMPFDYLVAYLASRVQNSEFVLRLPSAIWGTLSIFLVYLLSKQITENEKIALLSAGFLAITPIHVYYSQELRFYASLVFFVLAGTLALFHAIKIPTMKNWFIYDAIVLIGCFFHIYVLFVLILGTVWLFLLWLKKMNVDQIIGQFVISNIWVCAIVFSGVYLLTSNQHTGTVYENVFSRIISAVISGLGFEPLYIDNHTLSILFVFLISIPFVIGLIHYLKGKAGIWNQGMAILILVFTIIVIAFDLFKAYFIEARQFLGVLPFVLMVLSAGLFKLINWTAIHFPKIKNFNVIVLGIFVALIFLGNGYSLYRYYKTPKSYIREIVEQIQYPISDENTIYISPPYDVGSFLYYYQKEHGENYEGRLIGFEGTSIDSKVYIPGDMVILDQSLDSVDKTWLTNHGFESIYISNSLQNRDDILWLLPDSQ